MKYLYFLIFILPFSLSAEDWIHIDSLEYGDIPGSGWVQNISCPDSNNCYAFVQQSSDYLIKHSADQGASWQTIYTADPFNEEFPWMPNMWRPSSPQKDYLFLGMLEKPIIKKSTDGGKTFKRMIIDTLVTDPGRRLYGFVMYDTNIGFAANDYFWFVTKDGWETFEKYENAWYGKYPNSHIAPFFMDNNTIGAWYTSRSSEIRTQYFSKYDIEKEEWTVLSGIPRDPPESEYIQYLNDLCFVNDSLGFACGAQTTGDGDTAIELIFRTEDGGVTWDRIRKELYHPRFGLSYIEAYDSKNIIAVGSYGKIVVTRDGGENWLVDTLPKMENNPYGAMSLTITWAGQTPLIGTFSNGGGLYRYEGDFFDFSVEDTTNPDVITEEYANVGVRVRNSTRSLYISIDDEQFRKYELKIFDIQGNPEQSTIIQSGIGNSFRSVNIEGLKSGAYLYMVSCDGLPVRSGKFVVTR
ncbi:MAG: hypothetical protein KAH48_11995 [Chlorobi bacterium]|nr:hypothetical protein [Chlorobiota bacterium]